MMALADTLADLAGHVWPMAGLLPGRVAMQQRLAGIGAQGALYRIGSLTASYFHAWFPSCPAAVAAMFTRSDS